MSILMPASKLCEGIITRLTVTDAVSCCPFLNDVLTFSQCFSLLHYVGLSFRLP
jgi:hypothetical protein